MQIIISVAAANEVSKLFIGKDGIISTPAVSAIIRNRKTTGLMFVNYVMKKSRYKLIFLS